MTDLRALVSELAHIENGPPVVTLYLDVHWKDEQQRRRVRLFVHDRIQEAARLFADQPGEWARLTPNFERLTDWIESAVNQEIHPDAHGAMLVASVERNLFLETALGESFEPAMFIDTRPRLFPLVEAASLQRPVLLVSVDSEGIDVLDWQVGQVVGEQVIDHEVPKRHSRGGWSQANYQRHVRRVIRGVWQECSALLGRLVLESPKSDVILFGQAANLRTIERMLPATVLDRVIGMRPMPGDRNGLLRTAREVCDEDRVARQFAMVHRILRQGLSDRTGTVGLEASLLALDERRVKMLAVSPRFDPPGFRCTNCDALLTSAVAGCMYCGGRVEGVLLREAIARRCAMEKADVLVLPDGGPLDAYDGIGCLLRHVMGLEHQRPVTTPVEATV